MPRKSDDSLRKGKPLHSVPPQPPQQNAKIKPPISCKDCGSVEVSPRDSNCFRFCAPTAKAVCMLFYSFIPYGKVPYVANKKGAVMWFIICFCLKCFRKKTGSYSHPLIWHFWSTRTFVGTVAFFTVHEFRELILFVPRRRPTDLESLIKSHRSFPVVLYVPIGSQCPVASFCSRAFAQLDDCTQRVLADFQAPYFSIRIIFSINYFHPAQTTVNEPHNNTRSTLVYLISNFVGIHIFNT